MTGFWALVRYRFGAADQRRMELGITPVGPPVKPIYRWYWQ